MIKKIKTISSVAAVALLGGMLVINCEAESDRLGEQFFEGNGAEGTEVSYDLVAYNIFNNDTLRSDNALITNAALGAFDEGVFGMQKSAYVTQPRLSKYNPTFGTNAVIDSVVLSIKPNYVSDSVTTSTDETYTYPDGNIAARKIVNTYPIKKVGKSATSPLTFQVHEVTDFLGGYDEKRYSNLSVNVNPVMLGEKTLSTGKVSSVQIINKSTTADLVNLDAAIRIPLDNNFFKNKILDKQGSSELRDASNFIRWFKGVRISVAENDGYLFTFVPSNANIKVYYKYDEVSNGTTTSKKGNLSIALGAELSTRFSQIYFDRSSSIMQGAMATINTITGDKKLYAQGMGGPSIGLKIPDATVADLRNLYANDHNAIMTAKIRLYTDSDEWNNSYEKPNMLTILQKGSTTMLTDLTAFSALSTFNLVKSYNLDQNPAYYDLTVTQTVKEIIEANKENKDFVLHVGSFLKNGTTNTFFAPRYTSRAFTPNRTVFVGTDATNVNRARINIIYGKKIQ